MLAAFLQSLFVLGLVFLIGLMIGHIFGVMIHRAFDKIPAQSALHEETLFEIQAEYESLAKPVNTTHNHSYDEPRQLDLALIPESTPDFAAPQKKHETKTKTSNTDEIHYPVWSFGVITETHNQNRFAHERQLSPLALMNRLDLESSLRAVQVPTEPQRFETPPKSHRDELTRLTGLETNHQQALNRLGIYYFWQIASWDAPQTVWMASRIDFPELILIHHWIEQAAIELGCLKQDGPSETISWLNLGSLSPT